MPSDFNEIGLEAIAYQTTDFFVKLTDLVKQLRTSKVYTSKEAERIGISSLILEETGLSITIEPILDGLFPQASIEIPQMDKNHPLLNEYYRSWYTNKDTNKLRKLTNDKIEGVVDRKHSRVYGVFSKVDVPLYITDALLDWKEVDDAEVAAIILHELGHLFTYFEMLIETVTMNYAAWAATERIMHCERNEDRIKIITEYAKVIDESLLNDDTVANIGEVADIPPSEKAKGVVFTHLVSETIKNRRNQEGDLIYSMRNFEFVSDQFAVRHGAGKQLATALNKIYTKSAPESYHGWTMHVISNICTVLIWMCGMLFFLMIGSLILTGLLVLILVCARPLEKIYDDPKERLARIRREMVGELKLTITDKRRKEIVQDLATLDYLLSKMDDKANILEAIWKYVIPTGRKTVAKKEFQQSIERLANNDLFVSAAKLIN